MGYIFISILIVAAIDAFLIIYNAIIEKKINLSNLEYYSLEQLQQKVNDFSELNSNFYELKIGRSYSFTPDNTITIPKKEKYKYTDWLDFSHEIFHLIDFNENRDYWIIHSRVRITLIIYYVSLFFMNPLVNIVFAKNTVFLRFLFFVLIIMYLIFLYDVFKIEVNAHKRYISLYPNKNIKLSSKLSVIIQLLDFFIIGCIIIIMFYVILGLYR